MVALCKIARISLCSLSPLKGRPHNRIPCSARDSSATQALMYGSGFLHRRSRRWRWRRRCCRLAAAAPRGELATSRCRSQAHCSRPKRPASSGSFPPRRSRPKATRRRRRAPQSETRRESGGRAALFFPVRASFLAGPLGSRASLPRVWRRWHALNIFRACSLFFLCACVIAGRRRRASPCSYMWAPAAGTFGGTQVGSTWPGGPT